MYRNRPWQLALLKSKTKHRGADTRQLILRRLTGPAGCSLFSYAIDGTPMEGVKSQTWQVSLIVSKDK